MPQHEEDVNAAPVLQALLAASDAYEAALLANDVEGLDYWFWRDARVSRWGINESLYGYEAIQAFRQTRAIEGVARTLLERRIVSFGSDAAVVLVEFRREVDGRLGRQSQTWICFPAGWRIVMAHISLLP